MATLAQRFGTKRARWDRVGSNNPGSGISSYYQDGEHGVSVTLYDRSGEPRFDVFLAPADLAAINARQRKPPSSSVAGLIRTLKGARLMLYAWKGHRRNLGMIEHEELDRTIDEIEAVLAEHLRTPQGASQLAEADPL